MYLPLGLKYILSELDTCLLKKKKMCMPIKNDTDESTEIPHCFLLSSEEWTEERGWVSEVKQLVEANYSKLIARKSLKE